VSAATLLQATRGAAASLGYLALGDSYTIGEGVGAADCWPAQMAGALRAQGVALQDPRTVAATGWTTDELLAAMDAAALLPGYALVSLLIGVNNQYRDRSVDEYGAQFEALLQRAVALADGRPGRVLVLSIPDWGVTPFARADARGPAAIGAAIDAFNRRAAQVCEARAVAMVDITASSRAHDHQAVMLADDGLHPSAAMYALWAAQAQPAALRLLADR